MLWFNIIVLCALALFAPDPAAACSPAAPYLFHGAARERLQEIDSAQSDGEIERMVLLHNLAFHGDRQSRELAEQLNKQLRKRIGETPLLSAYRGSLEMIAVSHRSKAGKIIGKAFGGILFDSPYDNLREGFDRISKGLAADPNNRQLRLLRATAATEVGEHLPELLDDAYADLLYLGGQVDSTDSAATFFYYLSWAKYYCKRAVNSEQAHTFRDWEARRLAGEYLEIAIRYTCTPLYVAEHAIWDARVRQ
ncbi:MAG: hypothetical protein V1916_01940 [Patescibacteria group bacterium]